MRTLTEILVESLAKTKIFEMANSREKYIDVVRGLTDQVVQNWCLVKYCNMYDEENYNRLHWSKELLAHLGYIYRQKIKGGINKARTTKTAWIEQEEINDPEIVKIIIQNKFKDENIETDLDILSKEFVNHLNELIDAICNGSFEQVRKYVYEEI